MKNKELYDKTVGILVDAYFNDTLVIHSCGCGAGNIIAGNLGYKVIKIKKDACWIGKNNENIIPVWERVVCTSVGGLFWRTTQRIDAKKYKGIAKEQIDSTGYNPTEFAQIENAFGKGCSKRFVKDKMFSGLMAVIKVLDKIHENKDTTLTTQTKKRFNKNEKCFVYK